LITGTTGTIDGFLPEIRDAPLTSQVYSADLHYEFQDFSYPIESGLESLTFTFASTSGDEVVGIDSVRITGSVIPEPSTFIVFVGIALAVLFLNGCRGRPRVE
jgi:hypothetical protein